MYNIWINKYNELPYHIICKVGMNVIVSRCGVNKIVTFVDFVLTYEKTKYSSEPEELKTDYLDAFVFESIEDFEKRK